MAVISLLLLATFSWPRTTPSFGSKGADHVNGTLAATARPAHRLAVNPQDACQGTDHPGPRHSDSI